MADDQGILHAILTPEAYAGWRTFADTHGVTMSALCEALGRDFATTDRLTPKMARVIQDARLIAAERRARPR